MDIVNIDDHRKVWKTDAAACAACGHSWQAVYPVGAEDVGLECPACGSGLGSVLPNDDKSKLSPNDDIVERFRAKEYVLSAEEFIEAANEIERLRIDLEVAEDRKAKAQLFHNDMLKEIERLLQQNAKLVEALQLIADGPRDADKSYISLLHEVQLEARKALGEKK